MIAVKARSMNECKRRISPMDSGFLDAVLDYMLFDVLWNLPELCRSYPAILQQSVCVLFGFIQSSVTLNPSPLQL